MSYEIYIFTIKIIINTTDLKKSTRVLICKKEIIKGQARLLTAYYMS